MTYFLNKSIFTFLLLLACSYLSVTHAQIGIYTETLHPSAVLNIESKDNNKGVLVPRMTTAQKEAIKQPATSLLVYDTDKHCLSQNIGTEAAPDWMCLGQSEMRFFYMPSINIATPNIGSAPDLDLYAEYQKQFSAPVLKNADAPQNIPHYMKSSDLYYYVTYYDRSVMNITNISDEGIMSYTILKKADYDSFMNVVFVIK